MKKILITGGNGFIGNHLVNDLIRDYEVYVLDNHLPGFGNHDKNLKAKYINGDIRKIQDLIFATCGIDIVVHLAAISHVTKCKEHPSLAFDVNVTGTKNILEACRENNVKRIVIAGTDHIYGHSAKCPVSETSPRLGIHENDVYAVTKTMAVELALMYYKLYDLPVVINVSGNVFGEGQSKPNAIPNFIDAALKNEDITIHGDGSQTRDFYHVSNLVNAYRLCMETEDIEGEIFNFGSGTPRSINRIAQLVIDECRSMSKIIHTDDDIGMKEMYLDTTKSKMILGFKGKNSFKDELGKLIKSQMTAWNYAPKVKCPITYTININYKE